MMLVASKPVLRGASPPPGAAAPPPRRRRAVRHIGWLSVVLALALVASARPASAADEAKRRETFRQGVTAMSAEKWDDAFAIYRGLWDEEHTYDVALSLGQVELNLKKFRDAAEHLQFGLLNIPPREEAEVSERARHMLDLARKEIASVEVQVDRTGADVLVDERVVGKAPLPGSIFLQPGSHLIEARLTGLAPVRQNIDASAGQNTSMSLSFASDAAAPATDTASPQNGPASRPAAPVADSSGDDSTARTVVLVSGISVTAIAAVVTVTFAVQASSAASDAADARARAVSRFGENPCSRSPGAASSECADIASALDRHDSDNRVANTSLLIGALSGVATVATFFLWPSNRAPSERALRVVPTFGGNTGAVLTGSF